jgi:hypothetical protein
MNEGLEVNDLVHEAAVRVAACHPAVREDCLVGLYAAWFDIAFGSGLGSVASHRRAGQLIDRVRVYVTDIDDHHRRAKRTNHPTAI